MTRIWPRAWIACWNLRTASSGPSWPIAEDSMFARGEGGAKPGFPGLFACGLALLIGALTVQILPALPPRWFEYALLIAGIGLLIAWYRAGASKALVVTAIAIAAFGWTALR